MTDWLHDWLADWLNHVNGKSFRSSVWWSRPDLLVKHNMFTINSGNFIKYSLLMKRKGSFFSLWCIYSIWFNTALGITSMKADNIYEWCCLQWWITGLRYLPNGFNCSPRAEKILTAIYHDFRFDFKLNGWMNASLIDVSRYLGRIIQNKYNFDLDVENKYASYICNC